MKTGQFIVGMFDNIIEPYQSKGVENLVDPEDFRDLYDMGKHEEPGEYIVLHHDDYAISKTVITKTQDDDGRVFTQNWTVITKFEQPILKDIYNNTNIIKRLHKAFEHKPELVNPLPEITL